MRSLAIRNRPNCPACSHPIPQLKSSPGNDMPVLIHPISGPNDQAALRTGLVEMNYSSVGQGQNLSSGGDSDVHPLVEFGLSNDISPSIVRANSTFHR
jgi:hypothetical protein